VPPVSLTVVVLRRVILAVVLLAAFMLSLDHSPDGVVSAAKTVGLVALLGLVEPLLSIRTSRRQRAKNLLELPPGGIYRGGAQAKIRGASAAKRSKTVQGQMYIDDRGLRFDVARTRPPHSEEYPWTGVTAISLHPSKTHFAWLTGEGALQLSLADGGSRTFKILDFEMLADILAKYPECDSGSGPTLMSYPAGWYPDYRDANLRRYFDGVAWTGHTAPGS